MNTDSKNTETEQCAIPSVRRSFWNEFKHPLDKVKRNWLRRTFTILNLILIIPLGACIGVWEITRKWFKDCW